MCFISFPWYGFRKWRYQRKFCFCFCSFYLFHFEILWDCAYAATCFSFIFSYFAPCLHGTLPQVPWQQSIGSSNSCHFVDFFFFFLSFFNGNWLLEIMSHGIPSSALGRRCQVTNYLGIRSFLAKDQSSELLCQANWKSLSSHLLIIWRLREKVFFSQLGWEATRKFCSYAPSKFNCICLCEDTLKGCCFCTLNIEI